MLASLTRAVCLFADAGSQMFLRRSPNPDVDPLQVNVLAYLETMCIDTNAANQLVNSSLAILFVRMLRTSRAPALQVRLASVLGLLVRHATYIADELSQSGQSTPRACAIYVSLPPASKSSAALKTYAGCKV